MVSLSTDKDKESVGHHFLAWGPGDPQFLLVPTRQCWRGGFRGADSGQAQTQMNAWAA